MKIWLVEHPLSQYKEDVKALAKEAGLKIVDAKFDGQVKGEVEASPPSISKKGKRQLNKEAKEAQAALSVEAPKIENESPQVEV